MKPISTSELGALQFNGESNAAQKIQAHSNRIAWVRATSDKPNIHFNLVIKDGLGRIKMEKNCTIADSKEYGELLNLETMLGEDLEVSVEGIKSDENVQLFLN